ncbi:MAG: hypothetical protein LBN00_10600, partial [Oscillospiraceae bacterium]|nr:hypothetical protein [Oscillospiraceae bacterium]
AFLSKKYKKHPDKLVTENDERGQAINGKANAAAYGFSICALAAMSYVFALTDNSLAFYISLGALWLSFIAQYAFKKYYAKKM